MRAELAHARYVVQIIPEMIDRIAIGDPVPQADVDDVKRVQRR